MITLIWLIVGLIVIGVAMMFVTDEEYFASRAELNEDNEHR